MAHELESDIVKMHEPTEVAWSKEDQCYIAHGPHELFKAHGDTAEEAREKYKVALGEVIELQEEEAKKASTLDIPPN